MQKKSYLCALNWTKDKGRIVRRVLYILSLVLIALLLLGGVGLALLSSSELQTRAVEIVTTEISNTLGSSVRVGRVSYRFPASIRIEDFYVEDLNKDTLLYAHEIYARLKPKALLRNEIRFTDASVDGAYINIHDNNSQFLSPLFQSSDTKTTAMHVLIAAPKIAVTNSRVYVDDYRVDVNNFSLHLHELSKDTITIEVDELEGQYTYLPYLAQGAHPMVFRDFDTRIQICNRFTQLPYLELKLANSSLSIKDLSILFPEGIYDTESETAYDYAAAAPYISTNMTLEHLNIYLPDIAMLAPSFQQMHGRANIDGVVAGTLDSLYLKNFELKYNKQSILKADLYVKGLPDYHNAYVRATCSDFYINAGVAQDIISDLVRTPYHMPSAVQNLGQVHYKGQIAGVLHNLVLKGAFRTAQGIITTDGRLTTDDAFESLQFQGKLATRSFHMGRTLETEKVGDISLTMTTNVELLHQQLEAQALLVVDSVMVMGTTYCDLRLEGQTTEGGIAGSIMINDPTLAFKGYMNHTTYSDQRALTSLTIDSLAFHYGTDSVMMKELLLTHEAEPNGIKTIKLTSDYLAGAMIGEIDYGTLPITFKKQAIHYLPSLFSKEKRKQVLAQSSNNNFRFYLYGREIKRLQRVLQLPYRISDYPVMKGYVSEQDNHWVVQGYVPYVMKGKSRYEDITFSSDNLADRANVAFSAESGFTQMILHSFAEEDSCHVALKINNIDPSRTDSTDTGVRNYDKWEKLAKQIDFIEGDINLTASFAQYAGYPLVDLHLYPSFVQYGDSTYHINDSHLTYSVADTFLTVDHFRVGTQTQFIEANGIGSTHAEDCLSVHLGQLQADHLIHFVLPEQSLTVQGDISGWANVYSLFSNPAFEADVRVDSTGLNGYYIGETTAKMTVDTTNYNLLLNADVVENGHQVAHVDGLIETLNNRWGLDIYPDSFSVAFINHWPQGYLTDMSGRVSGKVKVFGEGAKTWVTADAYAQNVGITIPYTGCRYYVSDSIFMDSTSIIFPNLTLHDEEGNELYFDGRLYHDDYFKDFKFDLLARPNQTLVFNLPYKQGEMLSGRTYATGEVRVFGDEKDIMLTADARATKQSKFRFNVGYAYSASNNDFITFYDHHDTQLINEEDEDEEIIEPVKGPGSRFKMALNVEVDPTLNFALVLNGATGDEINARGDGAFTIGYDDKTGAVSMVGTYSIQQGTLGYTVANLLHRELTIAEGSSIVWSGVAERPTLNVTADYTVSANLKELFGSDVTAIGTSRTSIPVTTSINMSGDLEDPIIRFALSLPRSEQEIEDKVLGVINTEEMLMRQIVYLLVFGRFFTPEYMSSANNPMISTNAVYSILSSTVTTQINRWLGRLSDVFSMGVNVRKEGTGAQSSYEAEAKFQLQPIDRLVINGDIGYRYNDITNRPFFGDVDVEYLLTQNGKFRIKAYTHTVDKYSLRQASTIQGIGFVFKHDFNWRKAESLRKQKKDSLHKNLRKQ